MINESMIPCMESVRVIFWVVFVLSRFLYFGGVFNKTIIPLALVGYEMIIANSVLGASLAIYHLISKRACGMVVN